MSVFDWETSHEGVGRQACLVEPQICDHPNGDVSWHAGGFLAPTWKFKEWAVASKGADC